MNRLNREHRTLATHQRRNLGSRPLTPKLLALTAALANAGLRILVWRPAEFGDEQEDERGRFQDLTWTVTLTETTATP